MMTNVIDPIEMTSAAPAGSCGAVAGDESFNLREFSFNAPSGEPEGSEFAESAEEACRVWGMDLRNGDTRLMQVWGPGCDARWFRIERLSDGVDARECST